MAGAFLQRSRHGTVWYFRRRTPDDLRSLIGRPYIVKSLRTEQRRDAIIRARLLGTRTDTLFEELRSSMNKNKGVIRIEFALDSYLDESGKRTAKATDVQSGEHMDAASAVFALQAHFDGAPLPIAPAAAPAPTEKPFGMRFEDAIEDYLSNIGVSIASKNTYRPRLTKAMAFIGADADVRYLVKADIVKYSVHVKKTFTTYNSKRLHISQLLTLVNWMRDTYHWGTEISNRNLAPTKDTPDSHERDGFTLIQMKALFSNANLYRTDCPEKYWATIATAFLGCRITELAQINLDQDLTRHEAGFWSIRIAKSPEEDGSSQQGVNTQSVKNIASWRKLPIHPTLEKHGFIEFLLAQQAKGSNRRPFQSQWKPEVLKDKSPSGGVEDKIDTRIHWGRGVISWGRREMRMLRESETFSNLKGKLGYFHSMRHTFEGLMVDERIPFDIREAAIGHQYGGPDSERYAKLKENPQALLEQAYLPGLVKLAAMLDPDTQSCA